MTLRCVPVEYLRTLMDSVRRFGSLANNEEIIGDNHAPPPPKEIAEALELAERHMRLSEDPPADCKICTLSRALLQSWGRE